MTTKPATKSPILEAAHETASNLQCRGFIDQCKMRKFDVLCLDPIPDYDSEKFRALRDRFKLSQAVLAEHQSFHRTAVGGWAKASQRAIAKAAESDESAGAKGAGSVDLIQIFCSRPICSQ